MSHFSEKKCPLSALIDLPPGGLAARPASFIYIPDEHIGGGNLHISDDFDFLALAFKLYLKMRAL